MKRHLDRIYELYFALVYALAYRYYPNNADNITVEVFKNRIFKAVNKGYFESNDNCTAFIIYTTINYCTMKRFEEIYNRYFKIVYAIAHRHHRYDVDDVVAEIFEKKILAAIANGRFVEDRDYTGFIVRIAINQCHSIYQRNKSRRSEPLEETTNLVPLESCSLSSEILDPSSHIGMMIDFGIALEYLSRRQYLVIIMTVEGYTDQEIAKEMNTTVGAVRMLRLRARDTLRNILF